MQGKKHYQDCLFSTGYPTALLWDLNIDHLLSYL